MNSQQNKNMGGPSATINTTATTTSRLPAGRLPAYRDANNTSIPPSKLRPGNIMHDSRVIRGSAFAAPPLLPSVAEEMKRREVEAVDRKHRKEELARRATATEAAKRARTPEPVAGRAHSETQTTAYVEILVDKIPESNAETQTDAIRDRPMTPLFVPPPSGVDVATQVDESLVFDFDYEIRPILEAIVGRTLNDAITEVVREDERAAIAAATVEFEAARNAELHAALQIEAELLRRAAEKERRVKQQRARLAHEEAVAKKVCAVAFSHELVLGISQQLESQLQDAGFFFDPVRRNIQLNLLPTILKQLENITDMQENIARVLLDDLIATALFAQTNTISAVESTLPVSLAARTDILQPL